MHDPLPLDPELVARAAAVRREWRADEEEWSLAALEHFRHQRALTDVLRALMHRGDAVVLGVDPAAPRGVVVHVGTDWCRLDTAAGAVDVPVAGSAPVVQVVERSRRGGANGHDGAPAGWRARLLELETEGQRCLVEVVAGDARRGTVHVGADHLVVDGGEGEAYVPLGALLRIRPVTD